MISIAICENEAAHLQILEQALDTNMQEMDIPYTVREFPSGRELTDLLLSPDNNLSFDIVCMDIELEEDSASGISIAAVINQVIPNAQIIFVSQYLAYAPDVYETRHIFYVYKARLEELLPKALKAALKNLQTQAQQTLSFQTRTTQHQIPASQIWYLERQLRQTIICTRNEQYQTSEKMDLLQKRLPIYFVSCHRSYVVNLAAVSSIDRNSISFPDGRTIPLARSRTDDVRHAFARMLQSRS